VTHGVEIWLEAEYRWVFIQCEDREHAAAFARLNGRAGACPGRQVLKLEDGTVVLVHATE